MQSRRAEGSKDSLDAAGRAKQVPGVMDFEVAESRSLA